MTQVGRWLRQIHVNTLQYGEINWKHLFGARFGDSGSAIFGKSVCSSGLDFVGLLVSAWSDQDEFEGTFPELSAARFLASRVFSQLHRVTGPPPKSLVTRVRGFGRSKDMHTRSMDCDYI